MHRRFKDSLVLSLKRHCGDKTILAKIAIEVQEVTCNNKQSFKRLKMAKTDVQRGNKSELKNGCDTGTYLLITTEVAPSHCQEERGGAMAMKERGKRDRSKSVSSSNGTVRR